MKKKINISHSIREQIYNSLKEQIVANEYEPHQFIQIDHLAELFGVSATPVREALVRLESDGLVALIPNRGAQITGFTDKDIENIWEMRRLLEPAAARMSLERITDKEIENLENKIESLQSKPFDHELYTETDKLLHELFYIHLENDLLIDAIKKVHDMSERLRYFAEGSSQNTHDQIIRDVISEHIGILSKLKERNCEELMATLTSHLENGEKRALNARAESAKEQIG
ncbi:MAG: GntR family transcriptional regulator [Sphaerochaetaceae bacterium]|nr:GntR family transcriptional regulator [Sphaerochaetaceae bacterium]